MQQITGHYDQTIPLAMKHALNLCIMILTFTPCAAQVGPNIEDLERYVVARLYEIDDPALRLKVERLVFTALGQVNQPGQAGSCPDTHLRRLLETFLSLEDPATILQDVEFRSLVEHLLAENGPSQETPVNRGPCIKET